MAQFLANGKASTEAFLDDYALLAKSIHPPLPGDIRYPLA